MCHIGYLSSFLLITFFAAAEPYKILALLPHPGNSHQAVFEPLLQNLAENGHSLQVLSHFPPKRQHPNYKWTNIGVFDNLHKEVWDLNLFDKNYLGLENFLYIRDAMMLFDMGRSMCEALTKLPIVQKIVSEKEAFDVILVENFNSDCAVGVAHLIDAPVVALQSHVPMPWTYDRFGYPYNPSYMPCIFNSFGPHMTFMERLHNTLAHYLLKTLFVLLSQNPEKQIIETNLNCSLPPFDDINKRTVALISNTHFTLNGVRPLLPGMVETGGMHIKKKLEPLDPELEKYMNESTDGVILFTLGSMIRVSTFKPEKIEAFLKTFAEIKQNVIWKWEGEPIENLPNNVLLKKWVPQYELLNHPKTLAFISHGGLLGTTEALKVGMPVLFVPIFADQYTNAAAAQEAGLGIKVPLRSITKERISEGLKTVLSKEMKASAKEVSSQWNDRPSPLQVATETVEYVAKYKGKRLSSAAKDLKNYEFLLLDVILAVSLMSIILAFLCFKTCELFVRKFKRTTTVQKTKLQ